MDPRRFKHLKAEVSGNATPEQIVDLDEVVHDVLYRQMAEVALVHRTEAAVENRTCPRCGSHDIMLYGRDKNGRQRFKCRDCRRTYNILTGTPMARARKPEKWSAYLGYMADHKSIRGIVEAGIGLNHVTVWRWRHRFLRAAANDNAALLSGVIEADEVFFLRSFKGHRGWVNGQPPEERAARPRGWGATKRGLSSDQVPILTALDNAGGVFEAVLPSLAFVESALGGHIAAGSVVCSDGVKAYVKAAVKAGAEHRRIMVPTTTPSATKLEPVPTRKRAKGRLGLGHVNAHHEQIKTLINRRCRGVSSRYLESYLGWHRAMMRRGFDGLVLLNRALA